jgi:flavin-dependent dehydrogenase
MFANEYDVVIIGGGPAGIVGAVTAATLERRVALIDSHADLGGAGVNTGTAPSKPCGFKPSPDQIASLRLQRHKTLPAWNYTIKPQL